MIDSVFCNNLLRLRKAKELTQGQLESKSELPAMLISHYETGTRKPGLDNIKSLCRGLGCSATDLLGI